MPNENFTINQLPDIARKVRSNTLKAIHSAGSGHPGGALGITDALVYLYFMEMNVDPKNGEWEGRDRFVLSAAHMAPGLYAVLASRGFFDESELMNLRSFDSPLQGHTFRNLEIGVETTGGSLGQGFSVAIGFALAARLQGQDHRTYCVIGDGESNEGQIWEGIMFAAKEGLDNMCVVLDRNGIQLSDRSDSVMPLEPLAEKFRAFNWNVMEVDGHDFSQLGFAFGKAKLAKGKPSIIIAHTTPGKGVSYMENQWQWHGKAPDDEQLAQGLKELSNE